MNSEVWIGCVEVRQLPGAGHSITLSGKGALTWVVCWAGDYESYSASVSDVMHSYGLFVVDCEAVMPFREAEEKSFITEELLDQVHRVAMNAEWVIYGTFHTYKGDN